MINLKTHVTLLKNLSIKSMNISFQTSLLCPCMNSATSYSKTLTILRQILIFILCELFMFASDFHQIKTSIIKSVRPSFISSYEWKSQKSKCTLFFWRSTLCTCMQNLLQMNQSSSENKWCHRWPNNCVSHRKFTIKDQPVVNIIPISDSVDVKTLVPAPIQWQVQHTGWRKEEGRIGQKRLRVHLHPTFYKWPLTGIYAHPESARCGDIYLVLEHPWWGSSHCHRK